MRDDDSNRQSVSATFSSWMKKRLKDCLHCRHSDEKRFSPSSDKQTLCLHMTCFSLGGCEILWAFRIDVVLLDESKEMGTDAEARARLFYGEPYRDELSWLTFFYFRQLNLLFWRLQCIKCLSTRYNIARFSSALNLQSFSIRAHSTSVSRCGTARCKSLCRFYRVSIMSICRVFVFVFHASIPMTWTISQRNIVRCWQPTILHVVKTISMAGSITSNVKFRCTNKRFDGLFKMWRSCVVNTRHWQKPMQICARKSRTSIRKRRCSTRSSKEINSTKTKFKTSSVRQSSNFFRKTQHASIIDFLDRLNARISSQALELKENHVKIDNYEKELARVSPIAILQTRLPSLSEKWIASAIWCIGAQSWCSRNRNEVDQRSFERCARVGRNSASAGADHRANGSDDQQLYERETVPR